MTPALEHIECRDKLILFACLCGTSPAQREISPDDASSPCDQARWRAPSDVVARHKLVQPSGTRDTAAVQGRVRSPDVASKSSASDRRPNRPNNRTSLRSVPRQPEWVRLGILAPALREIRVMPKQHGRLRPIDRRRLPKPDCWRHELRQYRPSARSIAVLPRAAPCEFSSTCTGATATASGRPDQI